MPKFLLFVSAIVLSLGISAASAQENGMGVRMYLISSNAIAYVGEYKDAASCIAATTNIKGPDTPILNHPPVPYLASICIPMR